MVQVKEWDLRVGRMMIEYESCPRSSCLLRSCDVDEDQTVVMACMWKMKHIFVMICNEYE
jgi:hypothetical protein